jgi:hypothetical protein
MTTSTRILWEGLQVMSAVLEEWEQRALLSQDVRHPLVSRLRAVRMVCKAAIACAEDEPLTAQDSIQVAVNEVDTWYSLSRSEDGAPVLLRDEPDELGDMCDAVQLIAHDLAEWEMESATQRVQALEDLDVEFGIADENRLSRFRAMRACCEAIIMCLDDDVEAARPKTRVAAYETESWLELQNRV